MVSLDIAELSNEQRRQLVDVHQAFSVWHPAAMELERMGTMRAQCSKGRRYMYAVWGTVRKSLGRETPALKRQKAELDAKRVELKRREQSVRSRLEAMAPVNRALRLGRVPDIVARIVRALDREQLLGSHVIVAGTNALFAYEIAAGVVVSQQHVATTDADLIWDTNQSLLLAATGVRREGLIGILRRVDRSFKADYGLNATNDDGYIVDLLCPEPTDFPTTMKPGSDLEATPMHGIRWLLQAPQFEATVLGEDGMPCRIVVPEPRTFALHKLWVSKQPSRSAMKRPRDRSHAAIVSVLATQYLNLSFTPKEMPWLPAELKKLIPAIKALQLS
jgi:hypothetical protein